MVDRDERDEGTNGGSDHQPPTAQEGQPPGAPLAGAPRGAPWWYRPDTAQWQAQDAPAHPGAPWPSATPAGTEHAPPPGAPGGMGNPGGPNPAGPGGPGFGGPWASGAGWGWGHPGGWAGPPPAGNYPRSQHSRRFVTGALAGVVAASAVLIGVGVGYAVWNGGTAPASSSSRFIPQHRHTSSSLTAVTPSGKTSSASGSPSGLSSIAQKVDPALVDINTVLGYETEEAAGTGMVLTPTGKVLTNNHVIEGSTSISVTDLGNGRTYSAVVLGYSRTNDVALIQLKGASGLQTVSLGNSTSVKVGQAVVGIGNAGGVGGTPSVAGGSITALNQAITASDQGSLGTTTEHLTGLIQSDCNIQPGDSGGPLVDSSGKVVGMDTAASTAQGYSINGATTGQGYSIPINTALSIVHQVEAGRTSTTVHIGGTAFLGVYVSSTSGATRSGLGTGLGRTPTALPPGTSPPSGSGGALVVGVIAGTPAKSSGISTGDVITDIGGQSVSSVNDVTKIVMGYHPGQKVKVTWTTSSGGSQSATITLASGPAD